MKRVLSLVALCLVPALPAAAASCEVVVTDLPFGNYRYNSPDHVDTTGSLSVECADDGGDTTVSYAIALSSGYSGQFNPRVMAGDGELHYNVYVDAARTRIWGDGSGGSEEVVGGFMLPTASATHPVHARIAALQTGMGSGAYADQLIVIVSY